MRIPIYLLFALVIGSVSSVAQEYATRKFTCGYGISVNVPAHWTWDTEEVREAKATFAEMMTSLRSDGKIRLLNAGPDVGSTEGYARVRLSITTAAQFSQAEVRDLTEKELEELKRGAAEEFSVGQILHSTIDTNSIAVTKMRTSMNHWGYRIAYMRSGIGGRSVRVEQYFVPFSNRAVLLTLSHDIAHKEILGPMLLRIWSSLALDDETLWPQARD